MSGNRILLVESDDVTASYIQSTIEEDGYEVAAVAGTGFKAITLAKRLNPRLVVIDASIAGKIDGIQKEDSLLQQTF